jgi:RNA polymerase sigma-70 factor (ECF subfamily)
MAAIARDDADAFSALSGRWRPRLVNFFRGLGASPDGAEDCAQETLIRVYRYRDAYRPDSAFPSFLFTLARRAHADWRRKNLRHGGARGEVEEVPARDALGPRTDLLDLVHALDALPRRLRDVVELAAVRGLPYHRVSVLLGIPVGTVKSRMHHAVRRLRKSLDGGSA